MLPVSATNPIGQACSKTVASFQIAWRGEKQTSAGIESCLFTNGEWWRVGQRCDPATNLYPNIRLRQLYSTQTSPDTNGRRICGESIRTLRAYQVSSTIRHITVKCVENKGFWGGGI